MKRKLTAIALTLTCVLGSGCSWYSKRWGAEARVQELLTEERGGLFHDVVAENNKMMRDFHRDAIKFYEETGDAYFIIGYEYYKLAKELGEKEDVDGARQYAIRAKLYHEFSNDLQNAAAVRRDQLDAIEARLAAAQAPPPASAEEELPIAASEEFPLPPAAPTTASVLESESPSLVGEGDFAPIVEIPLARETAPLTP